MPTNELQTQWGRHIRAARTRAGLSLREVARRAAIDKGQLSRVEAGDGSLGDAARIRLAGALGTRVEDLFTYPETESSCPSAAPATDAERSQTPPTKAARRSSAPHAKAPAASDHEGSHESE